jgi:ribosomal protein L11 methyltransferase
MQAFEILVPAAREDAATAALAECGTAGIEVRPGPRGRVLLLAYFPRARGLAARLRTALATERAQVKAVPVPRVDWVAHFRAGFQPFTAGRFRVVPRWLAGAGARDPDTIVVEPGRAFGTGTHASTRLCLGALEALAAERALGAVADLGTGTGILAIAALRLGAGTADAVEIDPEAAASARLHARLNRVAPRIIEGDLAGPLRAGAYDTVLANLIAALHVERRDEIVGLGRRNARYVLAGLLDTDLPRIRRHYRGLGRLTVRRDGEWAAVVVHRGRA